MSSSSVPSSILPLTSPSANAAAANPVAVKGRKSNKTSSSSSGKKSSPPGTRSNSQGRSRHAVDTSPLVPLGNSQQVNASASAHADPSQPEAKVQVTKTTITTLSSSVANLQIDDEIDEIRSSSQSHLLHSSPHFFPSNPDPDASYPQGPCNNDQEFLLTAGITRDKFCPECSFAVKFHKINPLRSKHTIVAHRQSLLTKPSSPTSTLDDEEKPKGWNKNSAEAEVRDRERKSMKREADLPSPPFSDREDNDELDDRPPSSILFPKKISFSHDSDDPIITGEGKSAKTPEEKFYPRDPKPSDKHAAVKFVIDTYGLWDHNKPNPTIGLNKIFDTLHRKFRALDSAYLKKKWPVEAVIDMFKSQSVQTWIHSNLVMQEKTLEVALPILLKKYGGKTNDQKLEVEWTNFQQSKLDLTSYIDSFEDLIQRRNYDLTIPNVNVLIAEAFIQKLEQKLKTEFHRHPVYGRTTDDFRMDYEFVKDRIQKINDYLLSLESIRGHGLSSTGHTSSSSSSSTFSSSTSSTRSYNCKYHGSNRSHDTADCRDPKPKGILRNGNTNNGNRRDNDHPPRTSQTSILEYTAPKPSASSTPGKSHAAASSSPAKSSTSSASSGLPACTHCGKGHASDMCYKKFPDKAPDGWFSPPSSKPNNSNRAVQSPAAVSEEEGKSYSQPGIQTQHNSRRVNIDSNTDEGFRYGIDQIVNRSIRLLEEVVEGVGNDPRVIVILPTEFPLNVTPTPTVSSEIPSNILSLLTTSHRRIEAYSDSGCSNAQIHHALVQELNIPYDAAPSGDKLLLANGTTAQRIGRTKPLPIRLLFVEPNGSTKSPVIDLWWQFDIMNLHTKSSSKTLPIAQEIYFGKDLMVEVTRRVKLQSGDEGVGRFMKFILATEIPSTPPSTSSNTNASVVGSIQSSSESKASSPPLVDCNGEETTSPEISIDPALEFDILRDLNPLPTLEDEDQEGTERRTEATRIILSDERVIAAINRNKSIPRTSFCNHPDAKIPLILKPGVKDSQLFSRQYGIARTVKELMDEQIRKWEAEERIQDAPPLCVVNNPMLGVAKMEGGVAVRGKIRVCLDTRKLNSMLDINDVFRIQHISENHQKLANKKYYGEIDIEQCFTQFELEENCRYLTAFSWNNRQLMFRGAPFGIYFFPNWVHRFLSKHITTHNHYDEWLSSFIDNFSFGANTIEEHIEQLIKVIDRCTELNLRIKCGDDDIKVGYSRIRVLGHIISSNGLRPDNRKVDVIRLWPRPSNKKEMQSFLGTAGFIRQYIRHYADLTAPLEKEKLKDRIVWTPIMERHFELLKEAMTRAPFLRYPDFTRPFYIATDASQMGIGGVLYQPKDGEDDITPNNMVAIASKIISGSQLNYSTFKRELLAIIFCLTHFKRYVWGRIDTIVYTDHKPLKYMFATPNPSVTLQGWMDILAEHSILIRYRPGVANVLPDHLSRIYARHYTNKEWGVPKGISFDIRREDLDMGDPSHEVNVERTTSSLTQMAKSANSSHSNSTNNKSKKKSKVKTESSNPFALLANDEENEVKRAAAVTRSSSQSSSSPSPSLPTDSVKPSMHISSSVEDTVAGMRSIASGEKDCGITESTIAECLKRGKKIIPQADRMNVINTEHAKGHFGRDQVYTKLFDAGYWWPHMREDIQTATAQCSQCIRHVIKRRGFKPAEFITSDGPWHHIQIDCQTNMPIAHDGSTTILSIVDVFSSFCLLFPLKSHSASDIAQKLWYAFSIFGFPAILQSDNGKEFANLLVKELAKITAMDHRFIAAYNPRCDGKVERTFGIITPVISKLMEGATIYWPLFLPLVQLYINRRISSLTKSTPFALLFNREAVLPGEFPHSPELSSDPTALQKWTDFQFKVMDVIFPTLNESVRQRKEQMTRDVDARHKLIQDNDILVGSTVALLHPDVLLGKPLAKHSAKYQGEFTVVSKDQNGNLLLKDTVGGVMSRHVPPDQVKVIPSRPLNTEEKDIFEVEKVLKHQGEPGHFQYLVKWKGFPHSENTWEPSSNFDAVDCIREYWTRRDAAAQKIMEEEDNAEL
jgi:hypothetical protein